MVRNRACVAPTAAPLRSQAGSLSGFRPFGADRNIRHFLWYGGVAGDGLRSVGEEALPSSKSVCSILPIARRLSSRGFRAPAFAWIIGYMGK